MRRAARWLAVSSIALAACGEDRALTQIVVAIDSDLSALERIVVTTDHFGDAGPAAGDVGPEHPKLPRSLGLVYEGGPLGPVRITASARGADDRTLVERHAQVFFVRDQVRLLRLELTRNCKAVYESCGADQTCIDGECIEDEGKLEPWTGEVPDAWL